MPNSRTIFGIVATLLIAFLSTAALAQETAKPQGSAQKIPGVGKRDPQFGFFNSQLLEKRGGWVLVKTEDILGDHRVRFRTKCSWYAGPRGLQAYVNSNFIERLTSDERMLCQVAPVGVQPGITTIKEFPMLKTRNTLRPTAMLLATMFNTAVFAQETGNGSSNAQAGIVSQILGGEKRDLQFGSYKWRVLEVQGNRALMITEDVIEQRKYHGTYTDVTWETCDLRKYLNGDFLQKFSRDDQKLIAETKIQNPDSPEYGTDGGVDTVDKVFLLSIIEAEKYSGGGSTSDWWWLRSPGYENTDAALVGNGYVCVDGCVVNDISGGLRPVLWLNLKP
ncbi:MAG: DUF6273 domain-containing protein [Holophagaceae bacterium]|nr:DUF6273 domain-containing protein [Holophagaceae bacterium]